MTIELRSKTATTILNAVKFFLDHELCTKTYTDLVVTLSECETELTKNYPGANFTFTFEQCAAINAAMRYHSRFN